VLQGFVKKKVCLAFVEARPVRHGSILSDPPVIPKNPCPLLLLIDEDDVAAINSVHVRSSKIGCDRSPYYRTTT
jgi:hypothetical protein